MKSLKDYLRESEEFDYLFANGRTIITKENGILSIAPSGESQIFRVALEDMPSQHGQVIKVNRVAFVPRAGLYVYFVWESSSDSSPPNRRYDVTLGIDGDVSYGQSSTN